MKKYKVYVLLSVIFTLLLCIGMSAQGDTTNAPQLGETTTKDIFLLLKSIGVDIPMWLQLLLPVIVGAIIRHFTKKKVKAKVVEQLKDIHTGPNKESKLLQFIHKLEGKKPNTNAPGN